MKQSEMIFLKTDSKPLQ